MFYNRKHSVEKWDESPPFPWLHTRLYVIFHVIWLFNTNQDVTKIIDWLQKFSESSQENVCDRVHFSKVANPQCADYNAAIRRLHDRFFLEYTPKTSCLKKNTLRENLRSFGLAVHSLQFYQKKKSCRSRAYPCNFIKKGLHHRLLKFWKIFCDTSLPSIF